MFLLSKMNYIDGMTTRDIWQVTRYGARYHTVYMGTTDMVVNLIPSASYRIVVDAVARDRGLYGTCVIGGIADTLIDHPDETIGLVSREGTLSLTATYDGVTSTIAVDVEDDVSEVMYHLDMLMILPTGPSQGGIPHANPQKWMYEKGVIRR